VLVEAARSRPCSYDPVIVLSDVADAGILKIADQFQIPSRFVAPGLFKTKMTEAIEQEMVVHLQAAKVDFIALAGFMRVIKEPLLKAFPGRILNIHPSLLPQFPGLAAWRQAHEAKVKETGCTVHLVDEGIDTGEILGQARVPVFAEDTPETLHARIQEAEHELYPRIVNQFSKDLIAAKERKERKKSQCLISNSIRNTEGDEELQKVFRRWKIRDGRLG